ncbi:GGDEF domain-containing protein [Acidovorax facilis]|uniref:GGDEF domain-containing protein n=1 Tax=Acidovorax facilis TaxID=12917 RepID=UPI003CF6CBAC
MFRRLPLSLSDERAPTADGKDAPVSTATKASDGTDSSSESLNRNFDTRLSVHIAVAILATALLALTIIVPVVHEFELARQELHDLQHFRRALDTATLIAAERGPANVAMSETSLPAGAGDRRLAEVRARVDAALAGLAVSPVDTPWGLHEHPVPSDLLAGVAQQLAIARRRVDLVASAPRASVSLEALDDAIHGMFEASNKVQAMVRWQASELLRHDSSLAAPVLIGQMLNDLRDYGGRAASQMIAPIALGLPMPIKNVIDTRQTQGRLMELWQVIGSHGGLYDNEALARNRTEIEQSYFGEGFALIDQLIMEGRVEPRYSISATEFTQRYVPSMRPVETYRNAFMDAAVKKTAQNRDAALTTLIVVAMVTGAIFAILVWLVLSIRARVFRPLFHAHAAVVRLAEGHSTAPYAHSAAAGEVTGLFRAIDVLQGKLRERASMASELKIQADTDGLTGLLNRRALDRYAQASEGRDHPVCLILMDIDHFKAVNDGHGHPTGDRVLTEFARLLRNMLRSDDIVARFGGEEFAVLVPHDDMDGTRVIAEKLRRAIERAVFTTSQDAPLSLTASFGVACGSAGERAWTALVERADAALYRAKAEGRNCVRSAPVPPGLAEAQA